MTRTGTIILAAAAAMYSLVPHPRAEERKLSRDIAVEPVEEPAPRAVSHVHLTCYQPVKSQCDSDPTVTADGSRIDLDALERGDLKWIAVSPDLLWLFPMGSTVRVTSERTGRVYGEFQIRDKMNRRWNHRMDILISPNSKERISEADVRIELL